MLFAFAHDIKEACCVFPYFIAQFMQCHKFATARRHLQLFAAAVKHCELDKQDIEFRWILTDGTERCLHARHVTVVVRAPDVD